MTRQLSISIVMFCCFIVWTASVVRTWGLEEPDMLLTAGLKIDSFDTAMKRFGYSETMEDIRSFEKNHTLRMWDIQEGVLVVAYSLDTKTVSGMSYFLSDKNDRRLKGDSTSFLFLARDFNPRTRELKIVLKDVPKKR